MNNKYFETIALCTGAQHKKDVPNWTTIHDFDRVSNNKDFDASVYKQGNRLVIAFAGTNIKKSDDVQNDIDIFKNKIPGQYLEALKLYNAVKSDNRFKGCNIEFVGYSLGGTISNLMSYRTGLPSHVIAPIGSKDIASANKEHFKFDDSNITSYGRKGDIFFGNALRLGRQSGRIVILPNLKKDEAGNTPMLVENHYLHHFGKEDLSKAYIYERKKILPDLSKFNVTKTLGFIPKQIDGASFTGWKNPVNGNEQIYTKEDIAKMSKDEITAIWNELNWQARKIGIPSEQDMKDAQVRHGNVIHVNSYIRRSGVHVRDYWRSLR